MRACEVFHLMCRVDAFCYPNKKTYEEKRIVFYKNEKHYNTLDVFT